MFQTFCLISQKTIIFAKLNILALVFHYYKCRYIDGVLLEPLIVGSYAIWCRWAARQIKECGLLNNIYGELLVKDIERTDSMGGSKARDTGIKQIQLLCGYTKRLQQILKELLYNKRGEPLLVKFYKTYSIFVPLSLLSWSSQFSLTCLFFSFDSTISKTTIRLYVTNIWCMLIF